MRRLFVAMMRVGASLALPMVLAGCGVLQRGVFGAAGPVAESERHLLLIVGGVMLFVIGPVLLLTPLVAWHYRLANTGSAYRPKWSFSWWLEGLIWIPPTLIVIGLAYFLWTDTIRLDPYRPLPGPGQPLEVQAVALDWKWLFIYPEQHIALVNALVIPADRPVSMSLTSGTVMQSLMIPQLAGQVYAMAGMTSKLHFAAGAPGTYVGENVQYNGHGFQDQKFTVTAMSDADFAHWSAHTRQTGQKFDHAAFEQVLAKSVPKGPVSYADPPGDLFKTILDRFAPHMTMKTDPAGSTP